MQLKPRQRIQHKACGLDYTNTTKSAIDLIDGTCPQCHEPIALSDITGGIPPPKLNVFPPKGMAYAKLTLRPPPGMSFKNEFGGDVTLTYEEGRHEELFAYLQEQLDLFKSNQQAIGLAQQILSDPTIKPELLLQENILPPQVPAVHQEQEDMIRESLPIMDKKNSGVLDQPGIQHLKFEDD